MTNDQMDRILARYAAACPADFGDGDPHADAEAADDAARHTSGTVQYESAYVAEYVAGLRTARAVNAAGEAGDATGRFASPAALLPDEGWADQAEDFAAELDADPEAIRRAVAAGSCDQREIIDAQGDGWLCWCGRKNPIESVWCSHEEAGD